MAPSTPLTLGQLRPVHAGGARDFYRIGPDRLLMVVSDRLVAFDRVLGSTQPWRGEILNSLANYWFDRTAEVFPNHLVRQVAPSASLVHEAQPLPFHLTVWGYLCGELWRAYEKGERVFSGRILPDELERHTQLPIPIVAAQAAEGAPRGSGEDPVAASAVSRADFEALDEGALELFSRGAEVLQDRGLLLAEARYEFGRVRDELTVIGSLHCPDTSRFWLAEDWHRDPLAVEPLDDEYWRGWLRDEGFPAEPPDERVAESLRRARQLFERITGRPAPAAGRRRGRGEDRLYRHLVSERVITPGYVAIVAAADADVEEARAIGERVEAWGVAQHLRVVSVRDDPERVAELCDWYNRSLEPGAVIAVAGPRDGLPKVLAANLNLPLFHALPSSSAEPVRELPEAGCLVPASAAAEVALRALNLRPLRERFDAQRASSRGELAERDEHAWDA